MRYPRPLASTVSDLPEEPSPASPDSLDEPAWSAMSPMTHGVSDSGATTAANNAETLKGESAVTVSPIQISLLGLAFTQICEGCTPTPDPAQYVNVLAAACARLAGWELQTE